MTTLNWKVFIICLSLFPFASHSQSNSLLDLVDPFIGTAGHGHTYPGAVYPFGMVQLSPDTRLTGWDGCSAYHYSDSIVYGFSHTHLSGTGASDYGDVLLMPYSGLPNRYEQDKIGSLFDHAAEKASPGYYRTRLDDYGIDAELTVSPRCGLHRYTFQGEEDAFVMLDLIHRDFVLDSYLSITNDYELEGYRFSSAWASDQRIYFVIRFSLPMEEIILEKPSLDNPNSTEKEFRGDSIRMSFRFNLAKGDQLLVKVGISAVSIEGARKNLWEEMPNWDFERHVTETQNAWADQLRKIEIFGGSLEEKRTFYTALYHTMVVPNIFNDVDGKYRGLDGNIYQDSTRNTYTVFSLWDTYRATHPLYTLLERDRTVDFIKTMIAHQEQSGLLPVWELAGNETNCMIGTHGVSVISDALIKGMDGFDADKAYEAMRSSLEQDKHELNVYRERGYMPSDEVAESVSKTLEYAYDDWCLAQAAKSMGKDRDYQTYLTRSQNYRNLFDPSSGFMRPRSNGAWKTPFDPKEVDFNFTEANSWQYSFYVPHDIDYLMEAMGGESAFAKKLDALFTAGSQTSGRQQADITGLIGQYAHGNEPSHHMAYLYNFTGMPWKTQHYIDRIRDELYSDEPDGLCGNEDCGQMSAWYVFSSLGFYPVTPGSDTYLLGKPLFPRVILNFEDGNYFIIEGQKTSGSNGTYVQSVQLNKNPYEKSYIDHKDIIAGGKLSFYLGDKASDSFGVAPENRPSYRISEANTIPVPSLNDGTLSFKNKKLLSLYHPWPQIKILYRTKKGNRGFGKWKRYKKPIGVTYSGEIAFYAEDQNGNRSMIERSRFIRLDRNWQVSLTYPYSNQYTGGGKDGVLDQIKGSSHFADGRWQGYEGTDFEAIIDLGKLTTVSKVWAGFLQAQKSWIWFPEKLEIWVSKDNMEFTKVAEHVSGLDEKAEETLIERFEMEFDPSSTRYVKLIARNRKTCPEWHLGAGGKAWLFIDEIEIK